MTRHTRIATGLAMVAAVLGVPSTAFADPAGPTDFRTAIVSVTPQPDGVAVSVEGGDSFLMVRAEPGRTVDIPGYEGEPYLRIGPDGTVERNRRSFATYYNDDRYGEIDIPALVDNAATPDWEVVGTDGAWAWHDHRAHWMGVEPPIGLEAGESLPSQVVPIVVDGTPVSILVQTTLIAPPSLLPLLTVALVAGLIAVLGVRIGPAASTMLLGVIACCALVVGVGQWWSLPAETGRLVTWWLLPALAVVAIVGAVAAYGRSWMLLPAATALAGIQLVLWAAARNDALTKAVLPTGLPAWLDRGVTSAVLTIAVIVGAGSIVRLVRPAVR